MTRFLPATTVVRVIDGSTKIHLDHEGNPMKKIIGNILEVKAPAIIAFVVRGSGFFEGQGHSTGMGGCGRIVEERSQTMSRSIERASRGNTGKESSPGGHDDGRRMETLVRKG